MLKWPWYSRRGKRSAMKKSTETMIREGKPVRIEPIGASTDGAREDRLKIAARIVELSDQVLESKENADYIALKIESGPYSNAARVRNNRASFFIRSTDLFNRAKAEGFNPVEAPQTTQANKDKFRFWGLSLNDIEAHKALFREIVK